MSDAFLKLIGKVVATETAIRSVTAIVLRLLIGYFAGLPPEVISFDASIAFFLTLIFEFPTGLLADHIGYRNCISLGCYFQALAVLLVFLSIIAFKMGFTEWMWACMAGEAFFDAAGNTLISGAKEALFQDTVDEHTKGMTESEGKKFRSIYLSLAEGYSRWIPLISTVTMVLITVLSEKIFGSGVFFLPIIAIGWLYTERVYRNLYVLQIKRESKPKPILFSVKLMFIDFLNVFKIQGRKIVLLSIILCLSLFYNVFILINLFISILREHTFFEPSKALEETLLICGLITLGKILRSYLLPWAAKKISAKSLLALGSSSALLWGLCFTYFSSAPLKYRFASMLTLIIFSEIPIGWMTRPSQMLLLEIVKTEIRATFMSFISAIVFLLHTVLAIVFTASKEGVPNPHLLGVIASITAASIGFVIFLFFTLES